jgi:CubicO group peptidase (beta-lactamase class C family)
MFRLLIALSLLALPNTLRSAEPDPKTKPLEMLIQEAMKSFKVPGAAVVVVQDDKVILCQGFGVKKLGSADPVNEETIFAIASCTKAFTATGVAALVADGKLNWDDSVHLHLENFRLSDELADREVTLRDLLSHRSGMPRHDWLWVGLTTETDDLIRRFGRSPSSTSFRSTWEYSNVPFTTAGVAAAKAANTTWAELTKTRIFDPLNMKSTFCTAKESTAQPNHVTPHYGQADGVTRPCDWDNIDFARGAGSIGSTAKDLGNWLRFQLAGGVFDKRRIIPEQHLRETHTPQMLFRAEGAFAPYFPASVTNFTTYGLGWFVHDYRGFKAVSHGGTLTGFRAQCMLIPEKKLGVFVVSNLRPTYFPEAVCKAVLDHQIGAKGIDWIKFYQTELTKFENNWKQFKQKRLTERKPLTKPSRELKAYLGEFENFAYGKATVSQDGEQLLLKWGKFTFKLEHFHFDTFTLIPIAPVDQLFTFDRATLEMQFRLSSDGEITSLGFLDQIFVKSVKKK